MYKLHNLVMNEIDLGKSSGSLQNGSISLALNNATASVSGSYEAYTFWTTTGNLTLDIAGSLHLDISVAANNTLNMTSCTANYTTMDLDLQKSSVNWLAPILKPTIETTVRDILCGLVDTYMINITNNLIRDMPTKISGEGGEASVEVVGIEITQNTMDLSVQVGKEENVTISGFTSMHQDVCLQTREEVAGKLSKIFLPPGKLSTSLNVISLLYGENTAGKDDVNLRMNNSKSLKVGFAAGNTILASASVDTDIRVKHKASSEEESLGKVAMGGTITARCDYPGRRHVAQYAVNKLIPGNTFVELNGFNLATTDRGVVGCSMMKLRESFIQEIITKMTS